MTRTRAAWLALATALALAAGYLLIRRRSSTAALPVTAAPTASVPPTVVAAPPAGTPTPTPTPAVQRAPTDVVDIASDVQPVASAEAQVGGEVQAPVLEAPLPTWARAAIVVAALVAFFAVSLIATKHV